MDTGCATGSLELICIDTVAPPPASLGSRYGIMFVDSASRIYRPYVPREKSASAILAVVKRVVADMDVPGDFPYE